MEGVHNNDWRARAFVLSRGKNGNEHSYGYCGKRFNFLGHHTDHLPNLVNVPARAKLKCHQRGEMVSIHHNHPHALPLSVTDLELLDAYPGMLEIHAHAYGGGWFRARRAARWRSSWIDRFKLLDAQFVLQSLPYWGLTWYSSDLELHLFGLVLHKARLIDYKYRLDKKMHNVYSCNEVSCKALISSVA